jgi:hypothetical protein
MCDSSENNKEKRYYSCMSDPSMSPLAGETKERYCQKRSGYSGAHCFSAKTGKEVPC